MSNQRDSERLLDRAGAVLFDLDGTLLDTALDLVKALEYLCAENEQPMPDPQLAAKYVSTGAIGLVKLAFKDTDADRSEQLRQRLVDLYAENLCTYTVPFPGMMAVLERLESQGTPWGIVTNKIAELTDPLLIKIGLHERCAVAISGDSTPNSKPHPEPIEAAMRAINAQPADTLYIGDAPQDVAAGRAAGTTTVACTWGYIIPGTDPLSWQADYTIDTPQQLLELKVS